MQPDGPAVHFLNIEYFFRLLYGLFSGTLGSVASSDTSFANFLATISGIWLAITVLSYLFTLATIGVLVYATMRIYQVRQEEAAKYATISKEQEHAIVELSRWEYITQLINSGQESAWRQAIIEADIMLDELLDRLGYIGNTLGEKLRSVNSGQFGTLNNAWEAHRVRNEIAHSGSAYELSEHIAHRTIANYEAVFIEHHEI